MIHWVTMELLLFFIHQCFSRHVDPNSGTQLCNVTPPHFPAPTLVQPSSPRRLQQALVSHAVSLLSSSCSLIAPVNSLEVCWRDGIQRFTVSYCSLLFANQFSLKPSGNWQHGRYRLVYCDFSLKKKTSIKEIYKYARRKPSLQCYRLNHVPQIHVLKS